MKQQPIYTSLSRWASALLCSLMFCFTACQPEAETEPGQGGGDYVSITAQSQVLSVRNVSTRAVDSKTEAETTIHSMALFFLDASGNFITSTDEFGNPLAYQYVPSGSSLIVPRNGYESVATVYVFANLENAETEVFKDDDANGLPDNFEGGNTLDLIRAYVYKPASLSLSLPVTGMPMIGSATHDFDNGANSLTIDLKAMMARVDFKFDLNADKSDGDLPMLTTHSWTVKNLPLGTVLANESYAVTDLGKVGKIDAVTVQSVQMIYNRNGEITFSFYMFENIQHPTTTLADYLTGKVADPSVILSDPELGQHYKPSLANADATCVDVATSYTTADDVTYEVDYCLYLGANHTNDYQVKRNYQYKNNITITGITRTNLSGDVSRISYDARVTVKESPAVFISLLREHKLDAHFNVVPLDMYALSPKVENLNIRIQEPATHTWIRMERVPASDMAAGTVANSNNQVAVGGGYQPWHGVRKYFTTNLVTSTLAANTSYSNLEPRDRIYLYVDENVDPANANRSRTVDFIFTYEVDGVAHEQTLEIEQSGLIGPITATHNDGTSTFYIEAQEEYLENTDPLEDATSTPLVYAGLEWGCNGVTMGENYINVYCRGWDATNNIMTMSGYLNTINTRTLDLPPRCAAEYCYMRNKRNADGSITAANAKWYLPGIGELETLLKEYFSLYPEFQNHFYWSSASGKRRERVLFWYEYPEDTGYARATKVDENGTTAVSDWGDTYTNEAANYGKAPRTGLKLRIRALYMVSKP